jgi:DNA-binding PadR family transcriptional regulator
MAKSDLSFRFLILGLLDQRPMSGYDVKRLLAGLDWLIGSASFSSIYPALHALLEDGLVTVAVVTHKNRPSRKIHSITEKGREVLREWLDQPVPPKASSRAFVRQLILTQTLSKGELATHLHQRRTQVIDQRNTLKAMRNESQRAGPGWQLALDYGLALAETELDWLDRTLDQAVEQFAEEVVETAQVASVN